MARRQIHAEFDEDGVIVYQAFKSSIADEALRLGTFGKGFNLERMTWIKPSFGWMLYRSLYGTKHRQERILKIKLSHAGFLTILRMGFQLRSTHICSRGKTNGGRPSTARTFVISGIRTATCGSGVSTGVHCKLV